MHNIVVLGSNYAGASIAHYLLRHVIPLLNSSSDTTEHFKVTIISPSDHTYFTVGAPRVISSPEKVPAEKLFVSITKAFGKYKSSEFTFVLGEAVGINEEEKTISVNNAGAEDTTAIPYDALVVATGTTAHPLWTQHGDRAATVAAFQDIHKRLPKAGSVLIAGGGPTGVEVAAEIAFFYPQIDVTLLSGTTRLLSRVKNTGVSKAADRKLAALKVKTLHNLRVTASAKTEDDTKTALEFNDGSSRVVDVYLDATGGKPNSDFLPSSWLDISTSKIATDGQTLRTTKAPAGVYAIGDVASYSKANIIDATWCVPALGYSIWYDIKTGTVTGARDGEGKQGNSGASANLPALKEKKNKQIQSDMIIVATGPKGGVGALLGWRIPSWFVWLLKSRTYGIENASKFADGL
jgi:NADH dehydrogenase FAD-containing subunit